MKHTLINRFRGLFLSVAILEAHLQGNPQTKAPKGGKNLLQLPPGDLGWSQAMILTAKAILTPAQSPLQIMEIQNNDGELARQIARMLPLALFWHDNPPRLAEHINRQHKDEIDSEFQAGVLSIGCAIALICQEQVNPQTLIPKLLSSEFISGTRLSAQLHQVEALLKAHASLETVWDEINLKQTNISQDFGSAVALAFYCWASTADSFSLTISRTLSLPQPTFVIPLTAIALSGVSNSLCDIPLPWQIPLSSSSITRQNLLSEADQLFALWSGYYTPDRYPASNPLEQTAISAPGVLKSRH